MVSTPLVESDAGLQAYRRHWLRRDLPAVVLVSLALVGLREAALRMPGGPVVDWVPVTGLVSLVIVIGLVPPRPWTPRAQASVGTMIAAAALIWYSDLHRADVARWASGMQPSRELVIGCAVAAAVLAVIGVLVAWPERHDWERLRAARWAARHNGARQEG